MLRIDFRSTITQSSARGSPRTIDSLNQAEQLCHLPIWGLLAVSSGYGCHPDEKDFTCKFMHPHGHTENSYVTCQYGDYWWLALVMDVNPDEDFTCKFKHPHGHIERLCHLLIWGLLVVSSGYGCHPDEKDFTCKLMHPHSHTETFHWPSRDDEAYIPFSKILEIPRNLVLEDSIN